MSDERVKEDIYRNKRYDFYFLVYYFKNYEGRTEEVVRRVLGAHLGNICWGVDSKTGMPGI